MKMPITPDTPSSQADGHSTAAGDAGTVKFAVNGMVCAFCAQGIEKRLTKLNETGPLYINLAQKVVAVEPKPGKSIEVDLILSGQLSRSIGVLAISIGIAVVDANYRSADHILHDADIALYRAKDGGRNRRCTAPPP